jgi:hypothetical protein
MLLKDFDADVSIFDQNWKAFHALVYCMRDIDIWNHTFIGSDVSFMDSVKSGMYVHLAFT